jgi:hypothetical protein
VRASIGYGSNVRLYYDNWGDVSTLVAGIFSDRWPLLVQWAKAVQKVRAADKAGTDVPGILAALQAMPDVLSAKVGDTTTREKRYGTRAHYTYESGAYILLGIVRGSPLHEKVATKGDAGLQGRSFDSVTKCFRITIADGETWTDGAAVASVDSLFKHIGKSIADFKL